MLVTRLPRALLVAAIIVVLVTAAFFTRDHWSEWWKTDDHTGHSQKDRPPPLEEPTTLKLSSQARKNLGLVSKPVTLQSYWRTIQVPGIIVDRPGHSDRGVPAPAVSIVTKVHAFPGDTVKVGDRLFTLRLSSEYLQNTQSELFKTTRETSLVKEQLDRLRDLAKTGVIPEAKVIELESQLRRLTAAVQGYRQDLLTRGLVSLQVDAVANGKFVSEIEVVAPPPATDNKQLVGNKLDAIVNPDFKTDSTPVYEVQDLKVELGRQVQAGETLCVLANHQSLYIEGHSFKREAAVLEEAAQKGWPVRVEFAEEESKGWPLQEQTFSIRHLANAVDPASRTFSFFLPLSNQSRAYMKDGHTFLVWRYRPGQRVRLHVRVEEIGKEDGKPEEKVIVLPAAAVVREGPEAYVFLQNGDLFNRKPVQVLYEDRLNIVLANDGSITPGLYVAQNGAASLNRVLKAQAASGVPAGVHVHPDGTVHGAH